MTPERTRSLALSVWNGVVVFVAGWFLAFGFFRALVIGIFFAASCVLGFRRRWLLRLGLILSLVAVAVALGFPDTLRQVKATVKAIVYD